MMGRIFFMSAVIKVVIMRADNLSSTAVHRCIIILYDFDDDNNIMILSVLLVGKEVEWPPIQPHLCNVPYVVQGIVIIVVLQVHSTSG